MISKEYLLKVAEMLYGTGKLKFQLNLGFVRLIDILHGTNFSGRLFHDEIGISKERANDYSATPLDLVKTLNKLKINFNDSIADLGCGKGLAMYYMSIFPFRKIGGVELSEVLAKTCEKNLNKILKHDNRVSVDCCDCASWTEYDQYNYFYIYNSFPKNVLIEVIQQLNRSIERVPRNVTVLYLFPEYPDEFLFFKQWYLVKKGNRNQLREGMYVFINQR